MPIIIRGKNAALNSATAGLAEGVPQGFQMGLAARKQRADEERYADAKARAARMMELEDAQESRVAANDAEARTRRQAADEGARALTQWRTDFAGADEGKVVGAGMGPFRDLEALQDQKLGRFKEIVSRLPAEFQQRATQEFSAEMEDEQNVALIDHLKTRIEKQSASPLHGEGGPLAHRGEQRAQRFQGISELLEQAQTPEARTQAVKLASEAIRAQQMSDAEEYDRIQTVERTAQAYEQGMAGLQQTIAQAQASGVHPEILADMQASLQAMGTTIAAYRASNGEMTPAQLGSEMDRARRARAPRQSRGGGDSTPSGLDPLQRAKMSDHPFQKGEMPFNTPAAEGEVPLRDPTVEKAVEKTLFTPAPQAAAGEDSEETVRELHLQGRGREADEMALRLYRAGKRPKQKADKGKIPAGDLLRGH